MNRVCTSGERVAAAVNRHDLTLGTHRARRPIAVQRAGVNVVVIIMIQRGGSDGRVRSGINESCVGVIVVEGGVHRQAILYIQL